MSVPIDSRWLPARVKEGLWARPDTDLPVDPVGERVSSYEDLQQNFIPGVGLDVYLGHVDDEPEWQQVVAAAWALRRGARAPAPAPADDPRDLALAREFTGSCRLLRLAKISGQGGGHAVRRIAPEDPCVLLAFGPDDLLGSVMRAALQALEPTEDSEGEVWRLRTSDGCAWTGLLDTFDPRWSEQANVPAYAWLTPRRRIWLGVEVRGGPEFAGRVLLTGGPRGPLRVLRAWNINHVEAG